MLVWLKTIKKPSLIWGAALKTRLEQLFCLLFFLSCLLKFINKILKWNQRAREPCKFVCFPVFLIMLLSLFPSLGKSSGRYISCPTWSPCFSREITRTLVETYAQTASSSIWRETQKDAFLPRPLGPTLIPLSTSYISFCVEEPWTSKANQAEEGFAGCGKSRSLAPRNRRKLPIWWKCTKNWWRRGLCLENFNSWRQGSQQEVALSTVTV